MVHTAACAAAALARRGFKLLHAFHQNQSWDLSTVMVPVSPANKADHTEQTMLNWKIRFWSRGLFLTRWTALVLVHHQVLCSGLHIICGFCGPALTLGLIPFWICLPEKLLW